MSAFTKSFPDYDELARYFSTLTESYWVTSQVDVVDEQVAEPEAQMTVTWTLSLESRGTGEPQRRTQDLHLHLRQTKPPKWQIVKMQGVEFFRP